MSRIIEMLWTCSHCEHRNWGRYMRCGGCKNPKDGSETYDMPRDTESAPTVTDPARLREANAGANWECEMCGGHKRNLVGDCDGCGGKKDTLGYHPEARAPKQYHPEQYETRTYRPAVSSQQLIPSQYGWGNTHATEVDDDNDFMDSIRNAENLRVWIFLGVIVVVALLLFWLFMPYEVNTTITGIQWQHTVDLEERHLKHGEDWDGNMPSDAHNTSCSTKQRGTEDCNPHDCNPHQVDCNPHDCNCRESCSSNGNGYASCSTTCSTCYDSCTEYDTCYDQCAVYDEWCSYDYHEWDVIQTQTAGGESHEEHWPDFDLGGRSDLRNVRQAEYHVDFYSEEKDKTWDYQPDDINEFQKYVTNTPWLIKVNRAGQVWPQNEL